jgi:hypothetical protein
VGLLLLAGVGGWPPAQASGSDEPDRAGARLELDPDTLADGTDDQDGALDEETTQELSALLERLAQALARADEDAMAGLLHDPEGDVGERWLTRAANLAEVPFDGLGLRLDPRPGVMTTDRVRARFPDVDEVVVAGVLEEHVLAGHDVDGPARHQHTLTFVQEEGDWRLADDRDGRILGRPEPGFLWDLTPVTTTTQGPVLALHPEDASGVDGLVAETLAAMEILPQRWPADWSQRTVLSVPSDREQLSHIVGGTLDLDDFLAFASATGYSAPGVHEITGTRLVVNPERFPTSPEARERVLLHELVHVATRPVASSRLPLWLEEGVAQALGEEGPSTGHTRQLDALGPQGRRLPTDAEFAALGRQATLLAYQRSYSFTDHLVERRGRGAVVDFYLAVGESVHGPGTVGHRLDEAAERELGADLDTLVSEWRAAG